MVVRRAVSKARCVRHGGFRLRRDGDGWPPRRFGTMMMQIGEVVGTVSRSRPRRRSFRRRAYGCRAAATEYRQNDARERRARRHRRAFGHPTPKRRLARGAKGRRTARRVLVPKFASEGFSEMYAVQSPPPTTRQFLSRIAPTLEPDQFTSTPACC